MIVQILVAAVIALILGFFFLFRKVGTLDEKREVVQLFEDVEWNTDAAEYVKKCLRDLRRSLVAWMAGLMCLQTVVIFLALIYVLENAGR